MFSWKIHMYVVNKLWTKTLRKNGKTIKYDVTNYRNSFVIRSQRVCWPRDREQQQGQCSFA